MQLSILICTLHNRRESLSKLLDNLLLQKKNKDVEVVWLGDSKSMTVGEKRNWLLKMAIGNWVVFIDDDDIVSEDYVDTILDNIDDNFDCLTIGGYYTKNGDDLTMAKFSFKKEHGKNYNHRENGQMVHNRLPNHICVWKKDVAMRVKFPGKNLAEDHEWAEAQLLLDYTYKPINKEIYHYDFNRELSETR